jgi:hypothetical protein
MSKMKNSFIYMYGFRGAFLTLLKLQKLCHLETLALGPSTR